MRPLALAALLAGISSTALAADPANIIGTWAPTSLSSVRLGTAEAISPSDKPATSHDAAAGWTMAIDAQDGGAFAGTITGPNGKPGPLVGAFRLDGKRFVISTTNGSGSGEVDGDELEFCWSDNIPNLIAAGCSVFRRSH